jgi:hypothetical protein
VRPFSPGEKIYLMAVGGRFRGTNEPSVGGYLVQDIGKYFPFTAFRRLIAHTRLTLSLLQSGWYQTTLIPKDTRPTTVSNGFFLGANVINITRQTARVLIMNIRVRFDDLNKVRPDGAFPNQAALRFTSNAPVTVRTDYGRLFRPITPPC